MTSSDESIYIPALHNGFKYFVKENSSPQLKPGAIGRIFFQYLETIKYQSWLLTSHVTNKIQIWLVTCLKYVYAVLEKGDVTNGDFIL